PLVHASSTIGRRLPLRARVEQFDEEVGRELLRPLSEDAVWGLPVICTQNAQATDQNRHLRRYERQQLRLIDQQLLGGYAALGLPVVAESVRDRFEIGERLHIGLLLRRVPAPRSE